MCLLCSAQVVGGHRLERACRHLEHELSITSLFHDELLELDGDELAAVITPDDETVGISVKLLDAAAVEALVGALPAQAVEVQQV